MDKFYYIMSYTNLLFVLIGLAERGKEQMIRIGICDDEQVFRKKIADCVSECLENIQQQFEIVQFSSGEQVAEYDGEQIQLLFLDIELENMNGLEVLKELLDKKIVWRVVFVTSHDELMIEAFSVKTLGFLTKPVDPEKLTKLVDKVMDELAKNQVLQCSDGSEVFYVKTEDICYIQAIGNYSELHMIDQTRIVDGKLKIWQEKTCNMDIIRIHKSYIINLNHVMNWKNGQVMMSNGEKIPVGRSYIAVAKKAYFDFLKTKAMTTRR